MKKILFIALLLMSDFAFAQLNPSSFQFGPKVGANISKIALLGTGSNSASSKLSINYQAGVFGRFNLGKVSIQPEIVYDQMGGNMKTPSNKQVYRYISTPLILGVQVAKGIHLIAGPKYSWALNKNYVFESPTTATVKKISKYGPQSANDLGFVVGTRIDMLDMFSLFNLNIRYTRGMVDQYTLNTGTYKDLPVSFRNNNFEVGVSYNFSEYYTWWKKYGIKKKKKK
jgi:hypothetical protein